MIMQSEVWHAARLTQRFNAVAIQMLYVYNIAVPDSVIAMHYNILAKLNDWIG